MASSMRKTAGVHICSWCNKEILASGGEKIKTKRGNEFYVCKSCIEKSRRRNANETK